MIKSNLEISDFLYNIIQYNSVLFYDPFGSLSSVNLHHIS